MIEGLIEGELIDLSIELHPGKEDRRLEIRPFIFPLDKTIMHEVDTESHIGTHVEAPSHYKKELKDISKLPLEKFIGEAVCIDLSGLKPREAIKPEHLEGKVKSGDIVLLHSPYSGDERPYIAPETAKWLRDVGIKMLGIDDSIQLEYSYELMATHDYLLKNDIPIIERLCCLDKVKGKRFLLIAFPLKIAGLDSSPIRAVAVVPREGEG